MEMHTHLKAAMGSRQNPEQILAEALIREEPWAIRNLRKDLMEYGRQLVYKSKLREEEIEELVHDSLCIFLEKIRSRKFVFADRHPIAYGIRVLQYLASNRCRKWRLTTEEVQDHLVQDPVTPDLILENEEQSALLQRLIQKLGAQGAVVIRLFYFDNLSDEEVIEKKLTPYTTVNALKSSRCQYLKKLRAFFASSSV